MRRTVNGFVAEFRTHKSMESALKHANVTAPAEWTADKANFTVTEDNGDELVIGFSDDCGDVIGDARFIVRFDDVMCWA